MGALQDGMELLIDLGLVDVVLPFLLIFGISYGLLQKIQLFGKNGNYRNYNAMIAFCLGFFVVYNFKIVESLPEFIARIGILFIIILALMIVTGIFGLNKSYNKTIMMLVILVYLGYTVVDVYFPNFKIMLSESLIFTIVTVLIFSSIIWFVLRPTKKGKTVSSEEKSTKTENAPETPKPGVPTPPQKAPKQDQRETSEQPAPQERQRSPPREGTDMEIREPETIWKR